MKSKSTLAQHFRRPAVRNKRALPLLVGIAFGAMLTAGYGQTAAFYDDFEGGLGAWGQSSSPLTLSTAMNAVPSGGTKSANFSSSANLMYTTAHGWGLAGTNDSYRFSYWLYDTATNNLSLRPYASIRSYVAGYYSAGATDIGQMYAVGVYNTVDIGTFNSKKYCGRIYSGTPAGWFNLTDGPDASTGWHYFTIERGTNANNELILKFYVDGILGRKFTNTAGFHQRDIWNVAVAGMGAGSSAGAAWCDGFQVVKGQAFIGDEPRSTTNLVGTTATISVGAYGSASPITYAWYKNGALLSDNTKISGSTSGTLQVNNLDATDIGWYSVMVSNVWGVQTSAVPAYLKVSGIVVSTQPTNRIVNLGSNNVSFYAAAYGMGNIGYQWTKDGAAIASGTGTSASYTIAQVGTSDIAMNPGYVCVFTNDLGDTMPSSAATLRSNAPPWLATIPNLATNFNTPIAISVTVTDDFSITGIFQTFESATLGVAATLQHPSYAGSPTGYIDASDKAYTTNAFVPAGNPIAGARSYFMTMNFTNPGIAGWARVTTANFNPIVAFTGPLRFDIWTDRPMGVGVGLRETSPTGAIGGNGGASGNIEFAGVSQGGDVPIPVFVTTPHTWTNLLFDLANPAWANSYIWPSGLSSASDGILNSTTGLGVLEDLALTPNDGLGVYNVYLDNFQSIPLNGITFSLVAPVPAGATIDPTYGFIKWTTPSTAATTTFTVRATDSFGLSSTKTFTVTVPAAPNPEPLHYQVLNGQVVLTWTNASFPLESATAVSGPYTTIVGATSPYTNNLPGPRFFRLHWSQP